MKVPRQAVGEAVRHYWQVRTQQGKAQGSATGTRDHGRRTEATGGKQLYGFSSLTRRLLEGSGIPKDAIYDEGRAGVTIPGFYRPSKQWDVLVVANGHLLASIEFKALGGPSFGNNYNNRVEEALGNSRDFWDAYREGLFDNSPEPFIGYALLLEEDVKSTRPVKNYERHFNVMDEFKDASYADRSEWSLRKFVRERHYHAAALILSDVESAMKGEYKEPADDLSFERFATLMCTHVKAKYDSVT